jgi:hypothetical protein
MSSSSNSNISRAKRNQGTKAPTGKISLVNRMRAVFGQCKNLTKIPMHLKAELLGTRDEVLKELKKMTWSGQTKEDILKMKARLSVRGKQRAQEYKDKGLSVFASTGGGKGKSKGKTKKALTQASPEEVAMDGPYRNLPTRDPSGSKVRPKLSPAEQQIEGDWINSEDSEHSEDGSDDDEFSN